jgi:hypothetical protein
MKEDGTINVEHPTSNNEIRMKKDGRWRTEDGRRRELVN